MKCDKLKAHRIDNIISAYKIGKAFCMETEEQVYSKSEVDAAIEELKNEVSRQKRLRCYNLKMWCSAERFTHRGRTIPEEGRWWERHFYSVCRLWERFKEAI